MKTMVSYIASIALTAMALPSEAGFIRYASRRDCRESCATLVGDCRLQAGTGHDRRKCKRAWIKACTRFLGPAVCSPPDLRGTWEFNATVTDPPNSCSEPDGPVLFTIDAQGSFDLIGAAPISGVFADMPFTGTLLVNPETGVGFSLKGHGDQLSLCYLERSIGAGSKPGTEERNGGYAVRQYCNGSSTPVCQWGGAGTLFRRP